MWERLKILQDLILLQELFVSEIRYGQCTLPECCLRVADRTKPYLKEALHTVYQDFLENTGKNFEQIFRNQMEQSLLLTSLKEEDRRTFLSMVSDSGFADEAMQIRTIEISREELQKTVQCLERELSEKSKMAVGLGAMGGLLIVLVLM